MNLNYMEELKHGAYNKRIEYNAKTFIVADHEDNGLTILDWTLS